MKRVIIVLVTLFLLISGGMTVGLLAASHQVEVLKAININGVNLKPGTYKLTLNGDNTAELHRGRKLVAKARVELAPLAGATPNSISQNRNGQLLEIRLSDQKVVFFKPAVDGKTAR